MTTEVTPKTLEQLKLEIAAAATSGDDIAFNAAIREYNSRKTDIAKALAIAAQKEAEALAGVREKLSYSLRKQIVKAIPDIQAQLATVKATGFDFTCDGIDANGVPFKVSGINLKVPTVKAVKAGAGSGGVRTSDKEEFGLSKEQIFALHSTEADRDDATAIKENLKAGKIDKKTANSQLWQVKNKVKKAALAAGTLKPVR